MMRIETGLLIIALLIVWLRPTLGSSFFETLECSFFRLAQRRALSVLVVGLAALALRALLLPLFPVPEPVVHDEFGYLLAADTFSHGRLTNPTHPMWMHFESFELLQKPTYQCFSPPVQGMILAFGKVLFGHPYWGVWLSVGVMGAAITWMLQGWIAAEWALLGGVLSVLRYGPLTYWGNSYWGGAHGAIGGALVLGALPRIKADPRVRHTLWMGVGLAILANSRPYEGLVFSIPIAVALFAWMLKKNHPTFGTSLRQVVLPLTVLLVLAAIGTGYYYWRVTGSPFRMGYQVAGEAYSRVSWVLWQPIRPAPIYHNAVMEKIYGVLDPEYYKLSSTLIGYIAKGVVVWRFFLGPAFTLPLLTFIPFTSRDSHWRHLSSPNKFLLLEFAVFVLGSAILTYYNPHYSSPVTGLVLLFILEAIQSLRNWQPGGIFLSRAIVVICLLSFVLRSFAAPLHLPVGQYYEFAWHQTGHPSFGRAKVEKELHNMPGTHLVIVHYAPNHDAFNEWVYNDADIDHSKVVWARELGADQDQKLVQYFKDHQVWALEADEAPPRLHPYIQPAPETSLNRNSR